MRPRIALVAAAIAAALAGACTARYTGPARPFDPAELGDPGWIRVAGVPDVRQDGADRCGPAALAMVLAYWRIPARLAGLRVRDGGLRARDLRAVLRDHGLRAFVIAGGVDDLHHELAAGRPVIVGTMKAVDRRTVLAHFEVVVAYHPADRRVVTLDPAAGWRVTPLDGFLLEWGAAKHTTIVALP
jgi:ABC-type bacteriocin/lantibiotic exporter with double-glycine peptidase domain